MLGLINQRNTQANILKAIDFGCSQVVLPERGGLTKRTGTPVFMAPEVFNKFYAMPADIWSLVRLHRYIHSNGDTVYMLWSTQPFFIDRLRNPHRQGMLTYLLLTGRFPFWPSLAECRASKVDEVMRLVCGAPIPFEGGAWEETTPECRRFVAALLERDPARRLTASQAMSHEWFGVWA